MTSQLSLFEVIPSQPKQVTYDPYWDEITREPAKQLLMVVESTDTPVTTISKRAMGNGTGRITKRTISKNGTNYHQYWYDYQYYQDGKLIGRSRYIPKRLLSQIQAMESEKVPVIKILDLLGVKGQS